MTKKILFLLGSANLSGGTYVIFQHALYLQTHGFQVTIALVFMTMEELENLKKSDNCWHPAVKNLTFIHIDDAKCEQYDLAIFTWWATLFSFPKINSTTYMYFVQSIESRFYPKEETFMRDLVNRTYQLGLPVITEAKWIQNYLQINYDSHCDLVRNGIVKSLYNSQGKCIAEKSTQQLRILVEGPLDVDFKNVTKTIELCLQANVGEIWLLTSSAVHHYAGVTRIFSQVPIAQVPEIYRSCDVLVKLSYVEGMFGPPLEMFHCGGTTIVYDVTGYEEYIVHDVNALVAKTDDEKTVVQYLKRLHEDRNLLARLCAGARDTAEKWIDWDQSSNQFANALTTLIAECSTVNQKSSLAANITKYLHEHIDVVTLKNNERVQTLVTTEPLYDSGYYSLSIPITEGETYIGVMFGKMYHRLLIRKAELYGVGNSLPHSDLKLILDQMVEGPVLTFNCQSESSIFIMQTNVQDKNHIENAKFCLRIEFKPIVIRENLLVKQKVAIT